MIILPNRLPLRNTSNDKIIACYFITMTVDLEGTSTSRAARFLSRPSSNNEEAAGMPSLRHPLLGNKHEVYDSTPDTKSSAIPDDDPLRATYPPARHFHTPIPATQVFSRFSPPLFLPNLDDYLASLSVPSFRYKDQKGKQPMFPPFESLSSSGLTLEDLELNKSPPSSFDRASILSSIVSFFLGVLVRNMSTNPPCNVLFHRDLVLWPHITAFRVWPIRYSCLLSF